MTRRSFSTFGLTGGAPEIEKRPKRERRRRIRAGRRGFGRGSARLWLRMLGFIEIVTKGVDHGADNVVGRNTVARVGDKHNVGLTGAG